ncbi:MAG: hypothetical protein OEY63_00395 [Gemmatimonadota bacterium]|nr:hypothetical protein [Gemmatimonadota bacterium]MDH5803545.1 hypothetical protein [Gemmatimonadota bacterium]
MPVAIFQFAEVLRNLLDTMSPAEFEAKWDRAGFGKIGWRAMKDTWRVDYVLGDLVTREVDVLLHRAVRHGLFLAQEDSPESVHLRTFRIPELERLKHAAAAAFVAQKFGPAGLCTVLEDKKAPLARRYYSFFSLAERHPPDRWKVFSRHLVPHAHHAFLGAAAETARYYAGAGAAHRLMWLFERTRGNHLLRSFLSRRLLQSLTVLSDPDTLDFFRSLLISGHTYRDVEDCEVTRALVMVRRFTGSIEPNVKFSDLESGELLAHLAYAERTYAGLKDTLHPVKVI